MKVKKLYKKASAAVSVAIAALLFCTAPAMTLSAVGTQTITKETVMFNAPTDENPLGSAADFNGVIFGNLTGFRDTEGPVASIGNVEVASQICTRQGLNYLSHASNWVPIDTPNDEFAQAMNVGLILGGNGTCGNPVENGWVIVGPTAKYTGNALIGKSELFRGADSFMQDAQTKLTAKNAEMFTEGIKGAEVGTINVFKQGGKDNLKWAPLTAFTDVVVFEGHSEYWNIFDVDFANNAYAGAVWIYNVPAGSKVLMNVKNSAGTEVTMTQGSNGFLENVKSGLKSYSLPALEEEFGRNDLEAVRSATAEFAGRVLWNVDPTIKKINYRAGSNYILGSVLAPKADFQSVKDGSDSVNGTLVARNAAGASGSELHWFKFGGTYGNATEKPPVYPPIDPDDGENGTTKPPVTPPTDPDDGENGTTKPPVTPPTDTDDDKEDSTGGSGSGGSGSSGSGSGSGGSGSAGTDEDKDDTDNSSSDNDSENSDENGSDADNTSGDGLIPSDGDMAEIELGEGVEEAVNPGEHGGMYMIIIFAISVTGILLIMFVSRKKEK